MAENRLIQGPQNTENVMRTTFQDYYGQHIDVHNETGSGNVRIKVRTMASMNDLHGTKPEDCPIETDISLDETRLAMLISTLQAMV